MNREFAEFDYWEAWVTGKNDWPRALDWVDQAITVFRGQAPIVTTIENRWDAPDRMLLWEGQAGWANIHVLVEDDSLRVTCAAWIDIEDSSNSRLRYWCHNSNSDEERWRVRASSGVDAIEQILNSLGSAYALASTWRWDYQTREWSGDCVTEDSVAID